MHPKLKNTILTLIVVSVNMIILGGIALTIFWLESPNRSLLWIIFIPWLLILNFLWIDHYLDRSLLKSSLKRNSQFKYHLDSLLLKSSLRGNLKPLPLEITFRKKVYRFSLVSLIIYPVSSTILIFLLLRFLHTHEIGWWQELFARHDVLLVNLMSDVDAYTYSLFDVWYIDQSDGLGVYVDNGCVGLPAMAIFCSLFLFTPRPRSQDSTTKKDFLWRKANAITVAIVLIYGFNVIRASIQFCLYSRGYLWSVVHDSNGMLAITVTVHALIFLVSIVLMPEILISIYYAVKFGFVTIPQRLFIR